MRILFVAALHHLEEVTKLSRQSWKAILAETDDDHEWLPGPKQNGPFGGARLTEEMIGGWFAFLDEVDLILAGKKLLPFWHLLQLLLGVSRQPFVPRACG